jgi:hypothetical protein
LTLRKLSLKLGTTVISNSLDVWQHRIRTSRKLARGWAANVTAELIKHKKVIAYEYNILDMKSKSRVLDDSEKLRMGYLAKAESKNGVQMQIWLV